MRGEFTYMTMRGIQGDVESFMDEIGQHMPGVPEVPAEATLQLRIDLITEEADELYDELITLQQLRIDRASAPSALANLAKEVCDLIYVAVGTAAAAGIDLEPVWEAVHGSNMKKVSGPVRPDGKRLKPAGYQGPDITAIIRDQMQAT